MAVSVPKLAAVFPIVNCVGMYFEQMDHKNSGLIARLWNQQKIKHSFDEICLDWDGQSKLMVLVHLPSKYIRLVVGTKFEWRD